MDRVIVPKDEVVARIRASGLIAIMRHTDAAAAVETVQALRDGGVEIVEVTMNTAGALGMLRALANHFGDAIVLGAGTVMDVAAVDAAAEAGARLVVSPHLDEVLVRRAGEQGIAVIPGAFTPTEVVRAWRAGADFVKVFPAGPVGPNYIRGLRAPLGQIPLIPTGGITLENATAFVRAGAAALGLGSALVDTRLVARADWPALSARARSFVGAVRAGREG
ncbi:MAG: bifunctional 4-hydroxy-2-oxoglutarate aldolase/2-dehydro-3-deoxy-phosphogluconate aldolase [Chloroflexi bacterium]|nr:bifunctional 4-hydroxy-2-oxoglutarate aldolase/2-dehydro-3-deoxy-phosphogluconate aldolase [Chloroflexota bacterium]